MGSSVLRLLDKNQHIYVSTRGMGNKQPPVFNVFDTTMLSRLHWFPNSENIIRKLSNVLFNLAGLSLPKTMYTEKVINTTLTRSTTNSTQTTPHMVRNSKSTSYQVTEVHHRNQNKSRKIICVNKQFFNKSQQIRRKFITLKSSNPSPDQVRLVTEFQNKRVAVCKHKVDPLNSIEEGCEEL